jgi:nucleotide-binding universal stress UspA family protein
MDMRKILYATDLKEQTLSFSLLKGLLPLRRLGLEEMVFLQTTSSDDWIKGLSEAEIRSRVFVEKKIQVQKILDVARIQGVSLIVINLERGENSSYGAIIKKIIKESTLPLLFVNNTELSDVGESGFLSHVIFPTHWSAVSEKAFSYLLDFKDIIGELEIVTVINGKLTVKDLRELKKRLADARRRCLEVKIDAESHIYAGKVAEEILTAASDYKASAILMGGMSKERMTKKILTGSSSWKVTGVAKLPVLIVP